MYRQTDPPNTHTHNPSLLVKHVNQGYVHTWKVCNYVNEDVFFVNMKWWLYPHLPEIQVVYLNLHSWELFRGKWSLFVTFANGDNTLIMDSSELKGVVHPLFNSSKAFFELGISPIADASPVDVYWVWVYPLFTRFTNAPPQLQIDRHTAKQTKRKRERDTIQLPLILGDWFNVTMTDRQTDRQTKRERETIQLPLILGDWFNVTMTL